MSQDEWICSSCNETHASIESKVPGGCVSCIDILRYIEYEAPGMGVVGNDVSEVVCFNDDCKNRIKVDPNTLVEENEEAVSIESETYDMKEGEPTGRVRVEIYCSSDCRNDNYNPNISN